MTSEQGERIAETYNQSAFHDSFCQDLRCTTGKSQVQVHKLKTQVY